MLSTKWMARRELPAVLCEGLPAMMMGPEDDDQQSDNEDEVDDTDPDYVPGACLTPLVFVVVVVIVVLYVVLICPCVCMLCVWMCYSASAALSVWVLRPSLSLYVNWLETQEQGNMH